jgi:hypothetical protein
MKNVVVAEEKATAPKGPPTIFLVVCPNILLAMINQNCKKKNDEGAIVGTKLTKNGDGKM